MDGEMGVTDWYFELPIVTRVYFTGAMLTTLACTLDLLYLNAQLIWNKFQFHRLVTTFLFFAPTISIDLVFQMFFLVRYCRALEDTSFRNRPADMLVMLVFSALLMVVFVSCFSSALLFLGPSLTFMMVYVWGRRNPHQQLSFLGLLPFKAPFLPWVLLGFSWMLGSSVLVDVLGIIVGHVYFYLEDVFPAVAESRGWRIRKILHTPAVLHTLLGTQREDLVDNVPDFLDVAAPPPQEDAAADADPEPVPAPEPAGDGDAAQ